MTITAPISASESPALKPPRRVRLGGITALAQSAWMGFPLGSEILEPIRLAPGAVRRWTQVVRPHWPAGGLSLRGLWRREFGTPAYTARGFGFKVKSWIR